MTNEAKIHITSSELGSLWMIYIGKSAGLLISDLFKGKTIDKGAQSILTDFITEAQNMKNQTANLLNYENAVIPKGFDESDIVRESPPLFDDIFYIMYLRHMMKLNFAYNGVYSGMSYMKEVNDILKLNYDISNKYYMMATNYLLGKGAISKAPLCNYAKTSRIY